MEIACYRTLVRIRVPGHNANAYHIIDPERMVAAIIMMRFLPSFVLLSAEHIHPLYWCNHTCGSQFSGVLHTAGRSSCLPLPKNGITPFQMKGTGFYGPFWFHVGKEQYWGWELLQNMCAQHHENHYLWALGICSLHIPPLTVSLQHPGAWGWTIKETFSSMQQALIPQVPVWWKKRL